jgi:Arc/MetJ-type ribon-helix-helix transcriptional regulator
LSFPDDIDLIMSEVTVDLPSELRRQLEDRISHTEFESLDEYIRFVLQTIVEEDERASHHGRSAPNEQNDQLKERLEDLGYM